MMEFYQYILGAIETMTEQPLTLYFDLQPDTRPSFRSIGQAMVEFEKLVGETVFLVEPAIEFTLLYDSSAPGSLKVIAALKGLVSRERLRDLAIIIATTLVANGVSHIQGEAMDKVLIAIAGEEESLSEEDIQRLAAAIRDVERSETVRAPRRNIYRALEQDDSIGGISAVPNRAKKKPALIVPRDEFKNRAVKGRTVESLDEEVSRIVSEQVEVVLVQPPLIESNRQWKVFANGFEFGAKVLDENFKQQVLDGTTDLRLAGGVILDVTLETTQVYEDGVWKNKSYSIVEVHNWRQSPKQAELLLSHKHEDDQDTDQSE